MNDATLAQGNQVLNLILQKKIPLGRLQKLLVSDFLSDLLEADVTHFRDRHDFRRVLGLEPPNSFFVRVNYNRSIQDALKAGKYDFPDKDVTRQQFRSKRRGICATTIMLVRLKRKRFGEKQFENVTQQFNKQGLRGATLLELLAFGEKYPDEQLKSTIFALGSVWRTKRMRSRSRNSFVPSLTVDENYHRTLTLCEFGGLSWLGPESGRFAVIRK